MYITVKNSTYVHQYNDEISIISGLVLSGNVKTLHSVAYLHVSHFKISKDGSVCLVTVAFNIKAHWICRPVGGKPRHINNNLLTVC